MGDITGDTGEGLDIRNLVSGTDVIGVFPSGTFYTAGSNVNLESLPTDGNMNNPSWSLVYDANGNVGSVYQMIGTGSYVNVISWVGYSGTLPGIGSRVSNVGSWSVV